MDRGHVVAVVRPTCTLNQLASWSLEDVSEWLEGAASYTDISDQIPLQSFLAPHEVVATNMEAIGENLEWRIEQGLSNGDLRERESGLFTSESATIGQYTIIDTSKGPIVIEAGAQIGPYTLLRGPIYIGAKTKILEHSAIKDAVTLCHTTKIGGEVEASIVEPYSNKQHHGFLGHSYLGSWINLGAGTCNSDLKNTYGTVNMEYPFGRATTNMQFLGCIMGDYSKTAINTGIFTGKVIGVCSMMYGFVTSNVPSYVNYARLFGQVAGLPPEVMVSTQQRMFSRRNVEQRGCDIQLIYDMHRLTQSERDGLGVAG
jgi:glucose-1-phosphate thymidylyltransferase